MIKGFLSEIASHGDRGAVVPISRFDELRRDMEELRSQERHAWSDWMADRMKLPETPGFEPRSLIVIVTPSPMADMRFIYRGKTVSCRVPPSYADWAAIENKVLPYIHAFLEPRGYTALFADDFPQKQLAVHAGLARYGRSNICYSEEFGSFMRVMSYISDLPCDDAEWFPLRRMEECGECGACVAACPTGAIDSEHRIIDAWKCLTAMNEFPGEFPDWVQKSAHNCLVGCINCQAACPRNTQNRNNLAESLSFTEEETTEILNHKSDDAYSEPLTAKMKASGVFPPFWKTLPRNLGVLIENEKF